MARSTATRLSEHRADLPAWIRPQLCELVKEAPDGSDWLHEIKFDGYRLHARLDRGTVRLLTRTGLDWTHKYPAVASAVSQIEANQAYVDGELCGVRPDGTTSLSLMQAATDAGKSDALVYFVFDLLYLDGEAVSDGPLQQRKERLKALLANVPRRCNTVIIRSGAGWPSTGRHARCRWRGSSRSVPMRHMHRATAGFGSRPSACTERNSSSSAGLIPRARGRGSARCCWPIATSTAD